MKIQIGIVSSSANLAVTQKLERAAIEQVKSYKNTELWTVQAPGDVELPLICQGMLENGCLGVVALAALIKGDTPQFLYVCKSVERGLTLTMLKHNRPVGFGILIVNSLRQANSLSSKRENLGMVTAKSVVETVLLMEQIKQKAS